MRKLLILALLLCISVSVFSQTPSNTTSKDSTTVVKQSPFNTGFYPVGFFDFDLKYLIKYNNYEGLRLGVGGITNSKLSEDLKFGGYFARGFKDRDIKYSIGASALLNRSTRTWLSIYYVDDIREIGSFNYLTDARVYSVFEPRLVNVKQFYKHHTLQTNVQHEFSSKFQSELRFSRSRIDQIENYQFVKAGSVFENYEIAEVQAAIRISPKTTYFTREDGTIETSDALPNISAQVTRGISGINGSDFDYTKLGLKLDYNIKRVNLSSTNIILQGNYAIGDVPLTHLFHAYPNAPTKDAILQRFSVAGRRSFETMYFGEFFSDRLATVQVKHNFRRFYISKWFQPELALLSKHAWGDLRDLEPHQGIGFNTLEQFYSESGLEINKLFFGFGLSFAYRYGFYHLSEFEDNVSFKFTFYLQF